MNFWTRFILLLTLILCSTSVNGIICPEPDIITPCQCGGSQVYCTGVDVTQEVIDKTFKTIRDNNGLLPSDWLNLTQVTIEKTELSHIDLTPFFYLNADNIWIISNHNLASISGQDGPHGSIHVHYSLYLHSNLLTDEGLGDSFLYFDSQLRQLHLANNKFKGSDGLGGNSEFLRGLSNFTLLEAIYLYSNEITKIEGGQFASNNQLITLHLASNKIGWIGKDAFTFNPSLDPLRVESGIMISLDSNQLNESTINNIENGLLQLGRPLDLGLWFNQFEFLSDENFESLLRRSSVVYLHGNSLVCDERMKWLHDQPEVFQKNVNQAYCTNDPGFDVFTTTLIQ